MVEKRDFFIPPCIRRPRQGGSRRNIATPFGTEKLKWCSCPMVKKFRRYVYSFWRGPRTWQTDRRTDTACWHRPRLCIASRGKNRRAKLIDTLAVDDWAHLVQRGGAVGGLRPRSVPSSLYQNFNVTAQPSTASIPTSCLSMWHYNYLCPLKG